MIKSYEECEEHLQPVVMIYPGFLDLRLFDKMYEVNNDEYEITDISDRDKVIEILRTQGPKSVRELQELLYYKNRSHFLKEVINPLIASDKIYRDGNVKSPTALIKLKR